MTLAEYRQGPQLDAERDFVRAALDAHGWARGAASRALGVSPDGLRKIVARLGLGDEYVAKSPGRGRPRLPR